MGNSMHMQDGYLGVYIDAQSEEMKAIFLSTLSICLFIQCVIAFTAWNKMREQPNVNKRVNMCFLLCFLFAFTYTITFMVHHIRGPQHDTMDSVIFFINGISRGFFFEFLLLSYIVRLHITFKSSMYSMSMRLIVLFVILLILVLVTWTIAISCDFVNFADSVGFWDAACEPPMELISLILYFIGCVLAVYFFVSNISKLTKELVTSPEAVDTPSDIELSMGQQRLSVLSSKYTLLFGFAITSTMLFLFLMYSVRFNIRGPFYAIDYCINLWCMYLQFTFAKTHYMKCCKCCDARCRNRGLKRTLTMVHNHSTELISKSRIAEYAKVGVASNSSNSSMSQSSEEEAESPLCSSVSQSEEGGGQSSSPLTIHVE